MFSDSFAGIAPASAPGFVVAQLVGAAIGVGIDQAMRPTRATAGKLTEPGPAGTAGLP
jgi:hypothetical protein